MEERRVSGRKGLKIFVDHILSEDDHCLCVSEDVSAEGIRLTRLPGQGWGEPRHAWLQFDLADDGPAIRALGELRYDRDEQGRAVRGFRFKYLNPRARQRFDKFLAAQAMAR